MDLSIFNMRKRKKYWAVGPGSVLFKWSQGETCNRMYFTASHIFSTNTRCYGYEYNVDYDVVMCFARFNGFMDSINFDET